ncbi:Rhodanese-like protein [Calocera cornea HHB12733]|uniref:Rhodanese-like protein n=1 Tax=Calocera cornea HHB12733 TaxID=1353952 RepID=A0A165CW49_9BASI|nr:Rhodanese-like protein [Calocera cornea HHB12733]
MSFSLPYSYISGKELKNLLTSTTERPPKVIDVRDDDHIGGHIAQSVHAPSARFLHDVHKLVDDLKDEQVVVFHCALSQQRGPKAARIYAETRANLLPDGPAQKVVVLRGGFMQFQAEFRNEPTLFENFRPELWDM